MSNEDPGETRRRVNSGSGSCGRGLGTSQEKKHGQGSRVLKGSLGKRERKSEQLKSQHGGGGNGTGCVRMLGMGRECEFRQLKLCLTGGEV